MRRTTLAAIAVTTSLVLLPTVVAVAQADPTAPPTAACPHHQDMNEDHQRYIAQTGMPCPANGQGMMTGGKMDQTGMMNQNSQGMMGGNMMGMMSGVETGPVDCPRYSD